MKILGVRLDNINKNQALKKVADFLDSKNQNKIFTPNPEMLVDASCDDYFKETLNSSDLNICDGFGLSLFSGFKLKRITGVDFMLSICELAQKREKSIYLLGSGSDEVIKR